MAKEFVKGVTVGEATAEENTQPAVSTVETNEEETKQVIRANEEDFIAGLIAAADFASDEEETQRIEIVRNGKLAFAFYIINICMVTAGIIIYFRNKHFDALAEQNK